jgi:hypothetical protein
MKPGKKGEPLHWKRQCIITLECLAIIYITTFCLGYYLTHGGHLLSLGGIVASLVYIGILALCTYRIIQKLSLPALMIAAPIIPLIILIFVLSLIPILQYLA